jgi:hypothetical protein
VCVLKGRDFQSRRKWSMILATLAAEGMQVDLIRASSSLLECFAFNAQLRFPATRHRFS